MDVILDLHWSEGGTPGTDQVPGAQQEMADAGSVTFWQEVANEYKSNSRVLFELYNEPKLVSGGGWSVWQNGGSVGGFTAVGMNQLYAAVRGTGATNIVILGGIDWAYDLTGVLTHPIAGAMNLAYAVHPYYNNGKMPGDWAADWGAVLPMFPVIVTEFGRIDGSCDAGYAQQVLQYANSHQLSWIGWAWYPKDCSFPSLITGFDGTPTAVGTVVKNALLAAQGQ
jgi:endoglucanase